MVDLINMIDDFIDRRATDMNIRVIGWLKYLAIEYESYFELHVLNHPFSFIIDICTIS